MIPYSMLKGPARRRCDRLARKVREHGVAYVYRESDFRDAERLHNAGIIVAAIGKYRFWPGGKRPFRELALFPDRASAEECHPRTILPKSRRR